MTLHIPAEYILASTRALGIVALLPFGLSLGPIGIRLMLAVGAGVLYADMGGVAPAVSGIGLAAEFLMGCCLVLPVVIVLEAGSLAAEMIESARGQTLARFYDPFVHDFETSLSVLVRYLVWAFLAVSGILIDIVTAFAESLNAFPFSLLSDPTQWDIAVISRFGVVLYSSLGNVLQAALTVALPFAIVFMIVDLCSGFISKVVPQANLMGEGFLIKTIFCCAILIPLWSWGYPQSVLLAARRELVPF